jgi:hypothetical protein
MTKFRSKTVLALLSVVLSGCAVSSGQPASRIAEPAIAAAYRPLHGRVHLGLDPEDGAAVVIAPGIAVTNRHNSAMVDERQVIGAPGNPDTDLLFFRVQTRSSPPRAEPVVGAPVVAYGQGADGELRIAHGVVHAITAEPGFAVASWFSFEGDAGRGFSGGPVVDERGRLIGITFGFRDESGKRLFYAYEMARVQAEFDSLPVAGR